MDLREERFFFESEGAHCYAVLHHPAAVSGEQAARPGVVLCHPLLDFDLYEVPWTIRMVAGYARELARAGYPALRFDFRGSGQSDGEFENVTLGGCVSDAQRAVEVLVEKTGVEEVVLVGVRLAATAAMRVAARDGRVRRLVLWDPVPDPNANLRAVRRRARASLLAMGRGSDTPPATGGEAPTSLWSGGDGNEGRMDAGGYVIGPAFLAELKTWNSKPDVQAFQGRVLILQLIRDWMGAPGLRRELVKLDEAYRAAGADTHIAEAMDVHPAEWYRQPNYYPVWEETSAWLGHAPVAVR
ncbi:MAG TPA: alpha/beta fold hydrolase [Chloroflexota bacterium]|nr:alpha/beta fold hydrolase [Chloroflexota bacterium]